MSATKLVALLSFAAAAMLGLLSRTNGVTTMSGGRDSEDYVASDSRGYCYHHKLVAAQGWVTSDKLVPSC